MFSPSLLSRPQTSKGRIPIIKPSGAFFGFVFGFFFLCFFVCFFFCFLGPHLQHMEVPGLGVKSDLQPPAHTTATATRDPSRTCDPHHGSQQHWILNPLSEDRARTHTLMDTSQVCNPLSHDRNSNF